MEKYENKAVYIFNSKNTIAMALTIMSFGTGCVLNEKKEDAILAKRTIIEAAGTSKDLPADSTKDFKTVQLKTEENRGVSVSNTNTSNKGKRNIKRTGPVAETRRKTYDDNILHYNTVKLKGLVIDGNGEIIPGATIRLYGTTEGAMTDIDGNFELDYRNNADSIEISSLGYNTRYIKITKGGNGNMGKIQLTTSSNVLQDVVITTPYGPSFSKQNYVGAADVVTSSHVEGSRKKSKRNKTSRQKQTIHKQENTTLSAVYPNSNPAIQKNRWFDFTKWFKKSALVVLPSSQPVPDATDESYDSFVENPFENPLQSPLSTFSIDVDNAAYTNVRRFINNGQQVPKDAVRIEEMINFFNYHYPQPPGANPFSINTEYSDAPWNTEHKLLKIGLQGKLIPSDKLPPSNLVFLIDVSGSMSDANKLPLLKSSLKMLVAQLRKEDKVSIVVYAGNAGLALPPTSGGDKQTILDALENLEAGGSTAGGEGIELAYKIAQENFIKKGNNRVILATDGDFNVGASSDEDMQTLIEEKRKSNIFLTCLGYGMGNYKDSKMEILADKGNGNYAYIDNLQEANRFLVKEFSGTMYSIAKDVKIQIEFNPAFVKAYRLIGYENRKLQTEDFTNDAIDAGELGSGHTVTALYEVIPAGINDSFTNNMPVLKYSTAKASGQNYNDELATIKFRYKKPDGVRSNEMTAVIQHNPENFQDASKDYKLAAAVAWFGLKLRDSRFVFNKDKTSILNLAKQGIDNDTDGYKSEFVRLVETAL